MKLSLNLILLCIVVLGLIVVEIMSYLNMIFIYFSENFEFSESRVLFTVLFRAWEIFIFLFNPINYVN